MNVESIERIYRVDQMGSSNILAQIFLNGVFDENFEFWAILKHSILEKEVSPVVWITRVDVENGFWAFVLNLQFFDVFGGL